MERKWALIGPPLTCCASGHRSGKCFRATNLTAQPPPFSHPPTDGPDCSQASQAFLPPCLRKKVDREKKQKGKKSGGVGSGGGRWVLTLEGLGKARADVSKVKGLSENGFLSARVARMHAQALNAP